VKSNPANVINFLNVSYYSNGINFMNYYCHSICTSYILTSLIFGIIFVQLIVELLRIVSHQCHHQLDRLHLP
jgi:hypothetical protein